MKKQFLILALACASLCFVLGACQKEEDENEPEQPTPPSDMFVGVYDLDMVYDSITTSDGVWWSNEFFESMTGKHNPPEHGYLTITQEPDSSYTVSATFIKSATGEEKVFFTTSASKKDSILVLDDCTSDYYYSSTEELIHFTFKNFVNQYPTIYFKSIYSLYLGANYSYMTSFTCTKRQ